MTYRPIATRLESQADRWGNEGKDLPEPWVIPAADFEALLVELGRQWGKTLRVVTCIGPVTIVPDSA